MPKLMLSRARWKQSSYLRKRSNTWRNSHTGKVSKIPGGIPISFEPTHAHFYGGRVKISKPQSQRLQRIARVRE